jgi:hypothetical protein
MRYTFLLMYCIMIYQGSLLLLDLDLDLDLPMSQPNLTCVSFPLTKLHTYATLPTKQTCVSFPSNISRLSSLRPKRNFILCPNSSKHISFVYHTLLVGSLKMNTALEYSTRVVQEGDRRCKKSTLNDLAYLTPLRIPLMNPAYVSTETQLVPPSLLTYRIVSFEALSSYRVICVPYVSNELQ